jgi:Dyp-type peroxidase family
MPLPRIVRRGMSYGPSSGKVERGLVFMAYNANLAEQFETIQRWVAGGNSTHTYSKQADPFLFVPEEGNNQTFRFALPDGPGRPSRVLAIDLDPPAPEHNPLPKSLVSNDNKAFVKLRWGVYLFVPSLVTLSNVLNRPPSAVGHEESELGQTLIERAQSLPELERAAEWKRLLEDDEPRRVGERESIWSAIRTKHQGVLDTEYGVLVADPALFYTILQARSADRSEIFSVADYMPRMKCSIGEIFLGMDDGDEYRKLSSATRALLNRISFEDAFNKTVKKASEYLDAQFTLGSTEGLDCPPGYRNVTFNFRELLVSVLADICKIYFGIPQGNGESYAIVQGGLDWRQNRQGQCPGDFTSPSRYIFSPNPSAAVADIASWQGKLLRSSVGAWVSELRAKPELLDDPEMGPVTKAMLEDPAYANASSDTLGSAIIGAMLGFLPTVEGCVKGTMLEWVDSRDLWDLQNKLRSDDQETLFKRSQATLLTPMIEAMQKRPVPFMIWRTARADFALRGKMIAKDRKVVLCIESATQANLLLGKRDLSHMFGGSAREDSTHFDATKSSTHACPGYKTAMGVMLGVIATVLDYGSIRTSPSPLTFILTRKSAE